MDFGYVVNTNIWNTLWANGTGTMRENGFRVRFEVQLFDNAFDVDPFDLNLDVEYGSSDEIITSRRSKLKKKKTWTPTTSRSTYI